jgi:hypothetical protein
MTHTFATLEVSKATFDEIEGKLREAGYDHAFVEEFIDMNGIALEREQGEDVRHDTCLCPKRKPEHLSPAR